MARAYGKLKQALWTDSAWLKLTADAQWLYAYLVSQPTTDTAGVFPLMPTKWAKAGSDMTYERVLAAAKLLHTEGWIVVDHDTDEGLIRRHIRDDEAGSLVFLGALRRAGLAQSAPLRRVLLDEIRSLGKDFSEREQELVDDLANNLPDAGWVAPSPSPSSSASTQPFEDRSKTVRRPFEDRL